MKNFQKAVALMGAGFLVFHFTMTVLYTAPPEAVSEKVKNVSGVYLKPLFEQRWNLFAPEPPQYSRTFKFRMLNEDGDWSGWIDPGKDWREQHYKYRVSYHGKLYMVYQNMIIFLLIDQYHLSEEGVSTEETERKLKNSTSYQNIVHFIERYIQRYVYSGNLDAIEFRVEQISLEEMLEEGSLPQTQNHRFPIHYLDD